jgi:hypothetical protein
MLIIGHSLADIVQWRYLAYLAKKPAAAGWRRFFMVQGQGSA